jgi:hypothetical protein
MPGNSRVLGDAFVVVSPDTTGFRAMTDAEIRKALAGMKPVIKVGADITGVTNALTELKARMEVLAKTLATLRIGADTAGADAKIAALQARLHALIASVTNLKIGADTSGLTAAIARLVALEAATSKVTGAMRQAAPAVASVGDAAGRAAGTATIFAAAVAGMWTQARTGWGWFNALGGQITLFGGLLNKVLPAFLTHITLWHTLADAVIEFIAVVGPASLALIAFGIAGSDAAKEIQQRMQAVHTVMDATGQAVPPLTGAMEQLHNAVRPQVYQLFGDALLIMNSRTSEFSQLAKATGTVVDQLAGRLTNAIVSGNGLSQFMRNAVKDVQQLGTLIGNLGGIFGNVFKAFPGYANILLGIAVAVTHVIEQVSALAAPLVNAGLWFHGFIVWAGLATTAVVILGRMMIGFIAATIAPFIAGIVRTVGVLVTLTRQFGITTAAMTLMQETNPVVWIATAVAGLTALVIWLRSSSSATQDFVRQMQDMVKAAPVAQLVTTIQGAQLAVARQLTVAQQQLTAAQEQYTQYAGASAGAAAGVSQQLGKLQGNVDALTGAQKQLSEQSQTVTGHMADLTQVYGTSQAALGALTLAGITNSQMLDTNATDWAVVKTQVAAAVAAYGAMSTQSGVLGNDLDVVGRAATDQYQAVQKLNSAWSSFISDVTGSQTSFDTYAQGINTLSSAFSQAGGNAQALRDHLGRLTLTGTLTNAAMDGLSQSSLDLNSAFATQVSNTSKLYETWRTAGIAGDQFKAGVAASIAPLEQYAVGSQEATAQLVALAQQAGYQGPISLQALNKYLGINTDMLGKNSTAVQTVKNVTDQATQQEALLTGAMQAQGNYIASQLIGDINQAILKYDGVSAAASAYGDAIAKDGRDSDQAKAARQTLINDLVASGLAAGDSAGQIATMIAKVLNIPQQAALKIIMDGSGSYVIVQAGTPGSGPVNYAGAQQGGALIGHGAQQGWLVPGWGGGDRVPAMLEAGELVLPKNAARDPMAHAVARAYGVPGFQHGGLVETGSPDVLSGQFAVTMYDDFKAQMTATMVAAMRAGIKSAQAAAQAAAAAAAGISVPGQGGAGYAAFIAAAQQALALTNTPGSWLNDLSLIALYESGYNPNSINLTDSNAAAGDPSRGYMQTIMSTFLAYHQPGTSMNIYDPVANIAAAINYIKARYSSVFNVPGVISVSQGGAYVGYELGGLVGKLAAGGLAGLAGGAGQGHANDPSSLARYASGGTAGAQNKVSSLWLTDPDLSALAASAHAESAAFWQLAGMKLPASATPAQRSALAAWDKAVQKQQLATFGLTPPGTRGWWGGGPGLMEQLIDSLTNSRVPPWAAFGSAVSYLTKEVEGLGIPGGINPPGTPRDSGWVPWHFFNKQWAALLQSLENIPAHVAAARPWTPGALGPPHSVPGGVLQFDRGGYLPPGLSMAWNNTGRSEYVSPAGGPTVVLEVSGGGPGGTFDAFLLKWIQEHVRVRGGGSVQTAFGRRLSC